MATLVVIPIIGILVMFQTAVLSRMPLLYGTADVIMLFIAAWSLQERAENVWLWSLLCGLSIGIVSALPIAVPIVSYLIVTSLATMLRGRLWQIPILAMLAITILGTLETHGISALILNLTGSVLPMLETINLITLPSLMLNLLLSVPIFILVRDLVNWLYPEEIEL